LYFSENNAITEMATFSEKETQKGIFGNISRFGSGETEEKSKMGQYE
jgi:hypothetical protein